MSDDNWLDEHVELFAIDGLPSDERTRVQEELAGLPADRRSAYDAQIAETQETMAGYASRYAVNAPDEVRRLVLADFEARARSGDAAAAPVTAITSRQRWRRTAAFVAAAAVVVAAALGAGVFIGRTTAPTTQSTQADAVAAVLAAPDATATRGQLSDGLGTLLVVSTRAQNQAVAVLRGMTDPIPADRSLQLWLVGKAAAPVSAGVVDSGSAPPLLIGQVDGSTVLAATLEPRGGSAAPTTPILVQVRL